MPEKGKVIIMASFFNDLGKKISDASQGVANKGKNMVDIQKLKSQINDTEKQITAYYVELGKAYFEKNKDNDNYEYAELCNNIEAAQKQITDLNSQIRELKGIDICPKCGAEVANGQKFCSNCGASMPAAAPAAAAASRFCPSCGAAADADQKFCASCGSPID